jgi:hypothetical protein
VRQFDAEQKWLARVVAGRRTILAQADDRSRTQPADCSEPIAAS